MKDYLDRKYGEVFHACFYLLLRMRHVETCSPKCINKALIFPLDGVIWAGGRVDPSAVIS